MEIAQPAQGVCDGGESHRRGIGVDEFAVAGDEKAGRAEVSIHQNSIDTGKMRRSSLDPTFLLA